jgi:DNA-directed RNA polymerase subunit D
LVSFNVKDVDMPVLNALRRTVISEIKTMAIENVTYTTNTSILNDEILAHRLGLIPLKTDQKLFNLPWECTCKGKGCGKCTVKLTLKAEGPCTVYSSQLKAADGETNPIYGTIPLVKLIANQRIELEATAQLGTAQDHSKWQAGLASFEEKEDGSYDCFIESYGQLPLKTLVENTFENFEDKLKQLKEHIK